MQDRGVTIVKLAEELLHHHAVGSTPISHRTPSRAKTPATLCLAAMLFSAASGSAITYALGESFRPINRYEKVELDALIFYASRVKSLNEADLRRDLQDRFDLLSLDDMTAEDYRKARDYLREKVL